MKSDFISFFHVSPYVYNPLQGQTIHWGQNFDDNRKAFSLCPYVASFKMISSKSDFIHIFNDFIHVYNPGATLREHLHANKVVLYLGHSFLYFINFINEFYTKINNFVKNKIK